jgi:hypothetical protein
VFQNAQEDGGSLGPELQLGDNKDVGTNIIILDDE